MYLIFEGSHERNTHTHKKKQTWQKTWNL